MTNNTNENIYEKRLHKLENKYSDMHQELSRLVIMNNRLESRIRDFKNTLSIILIMVFLVVGVYLYMDNKTSHAYMNSIEERVNNIEFQIHEED